jgi:hypothetical protein
MKIGNNPIGGGETIEAHTTGCESGDQKRNDLVTSQSYSLFYD